MEKYKRIKKLRGRPEFDDLENSLDFVEGIDESKIKICTEKLVEIKLCVLNMKVKFGKKVEKV